MKVFVYGSLLSGFGNHRLLEGSRLIGHAKTPPGYRMHSLGGFPGVVPTGNAVVHGEVYEVDAQTLAALDRLEGHPRFYRRRPICLANGAIVDTYLLSQHQVADRPVVATGDWRRHRQGAER